VLPLLLFSPHIFPYRKPPLKGPVVFHDPHILISPDPESCRALFFGISFSLSFFFIAIRSGKNVFSSSHCNTHQNSTKFQNKILPLPRLPYAPPWKRWWKELCTKYPFFRLVAPFFLKERPTQAAYPAPPPSWDYDF